MEQTFDFGFAIAIMKQGKKVCRTGWNGKGMWIAIHAAEEDKPVKIMNQPMTKEYIYMRTVNGECVPWLASQTDILSNDWKEVI